MKSYHWDIPYGSINNICIYWVNKKFQFECYIKLSQEPFGGSPIGQKSNNTC